MVDGSRDEFDALAVAVNAMLDRIEQQTTTLRTAFDSIAHGPAHAAVSHAGWWLERLNFRAGLPKEAHELIAPALHELDRVQRTLATRPHIARAEASGLTTHGEHVDLAALASTMVGAVRAGHARRRAARGTGRADCRARTGNRQLLARRVTNLLEYALEYVPAGGHVRVSVPTRRRGVSFSVLMTGPASPPWIARQRCGPSCA